MYNWYTNLTVLPEFLWQLSCNKVFLCDFKALPLKTLGFVFDFGISTVLTSLFQEEMHNVKLALQDGEVGAHFISRHVRFISLRSSNSEEWGKLACDVIKGLRLFCFQEECMQTCDSVIQNRCRMQGRSAFGGIRSTTCLGESNPFHPVPLSQCHSSRSEKKTKEVRWLLGSRTERGSHRAGRRYRALRCCEKQGFTWPVYSSLSSCAKLNIVKLAKTQIWDKRPSDYSIQTSLRPN